MGTASVHPQISVSGSGQILMAHWEAGTAVTMDAFFAEQLQIDTGETFQNGLYIRVIHSNGFSSDIIAYGEDLTIENYDSAIRITATNQNFYYNNAYNAKHDILLKWTLSSDLISLADGYHSAFDFVSTTGEFYTANAEITIDGGTSFHPVTYETVGIAGNTAHKEISNAVVSLSGDTSIVAGDDAVYTVSVNNVNKLATVTLWFEADGTYFTGKTFNGLNGFSILGDIQWTQNGNIWTGRATLINNSGVNSNSALDIFEMVFSSNSDQLGNTAVKLIKADLSGYNANTDQAIYIDSSIANNQIQTMINQYFSIYDTNKDGKIDQLDLTTAQLFYMAEEGDANWNTAKIADINNDGRVDISDLILILNNIDWSSPLS
jgi:hypothetical protein